MNYWLWLGAALGVGFGLLSSTLAAIASVLKSASLSKKRGTLILLFISNVASGMVHFKSETDKTVKEAGFIILFLEASIYKTKFSFLSSPEVSCILIIFLTNSLSPSPLTAVAQILAFICWLVQFYQYLTHNVLTTTDRETHWYTHGLASLGHSFYFLVVGLLFVFVNIGLLIAAVNMERREHRKARHDDPAYDEKAQGAIMLY